MHLVELGFELQTQLNFLLVVLCVLGVFLFKLKSHLTLVHSLFFERFRVLLEDFHVLLYDLLVVCLLLESCLVLIFELFNLLLVFLGNFLNEHSVISSTAILEQDRKNFPESRYNGVFLVSMVETLFDEFIKTYRVYK